jgi:DNA end-binding protein Ku
MEPSQYRDTYTGRLNDLIEAKKHHKQFEAADEAPPTTNADGLADALKASLDAARKPSQEAPLQEGDRRQENVCDEDGSEEARK